MSLFQRSSDFRAPSRAVALARKCIATGDDRAALVARLALGAVIFPHGAQKVLGWFGGYGLSGTLDMFTHNMGIPLFFAILAIAAEFLGSIGLIVGFLGRVAALGVASVMTVAIFMVHAPNGFFMNWSGSQKGEGFEFHLLALGLAASVMIRGSGALSLDRLLTRAAETPAPEAPRAGWQVGTAPA
jgi:putative oxidoreductase